MAQARIALKFVGKALGWLVGGLLGLVACALFALNFLLQTEFFTRFVLDQVLPPVGKAICAKIEVQKLRLRFVPFRLEIAGARYTDPAEKYAQPFATFDRLLVKVKTAPLLQGQVVVSEVSLEGASNYLYLADGLENLPLCPSPPEPEEPFEPFKLKLPIVAKKIHIDAKFRMDMPPVTVASTPENPNPPLSTPLTITAAAVNLDAHADLNAGDAFVQARIADANLEIGDLADRVNELRIDAKANLQDWNAQVERLELALPNLSLRGSAEAKDLLEELEAVAHLTVTSDLHKVNQLVLQSDQDVQLNGGFTLETDGGVKLGKERLTYWGKGSLALPAGSVNDLALRALRLEFDVDRDKADVNALHLETAGGAADVKAHLDFAQGMPVTATVKLADLNVGEALQKYGLKDIAAAGVVDADLAARGLLDPLKLDARGEIAARNAGYGDAVRVGAVNLDLDATTEGAKNQIRQLTLTARDIAAGGGVVPEANVTLRGEVGAAGAKVDTLVVATPKTHIDVRGTANFAGPLNLDALIDLTDLSEFKSFVGDKNLSGRGRLAAKAGGVMRNPDVRGELSFAQVAFDAAAIDSVTANVGYVDRRAFVENLNVAAAGARIQADAAYDLGAAEPALTARLALPETQIADLLKLAGQQDKVKVEGAASLRVDVKGPLKRLNGQVALEGKNIVAYNEAVERVNLSTRLDDGLALIDDLSIVKKRGVRPIVERGVWRPKPEKQITDADREPARIVLTGRLHPFEQTFELKLRSANLTEMASDNVIKERVQAMADVALNADLAGSFARPAGAVRLAIERGRFQHIDLGNSTVDVRLENQQVLVNGELLADRRPTGWDQRRAAVCPPEEDEAPECDVPGGGVEAAAAAEDPDFGGTTPPPAPRSGRLGSIKLTATLGLTEGLPVSGNLTFDKFDYSPFVQSPPKDKLKVKGRGRAPRPAGVTTTRASGGMIDGAVVIKGLLAKPRTAEGAAADAPPTAVDLSVDLRIDELLFKYNRFVLRNQDDAGRLAPLIISYRNGQVTAPSFSLGGEGVRVRLTNESLRGEGFWVLAADVDVSVASSFTDALTESSGQLTLRAEVPMAFDLGKVVADLKLPKANFVIKNVPTPVENLALAVHFADRTATIQTLAADFGGGKLLGGGAYKLPAPAPATPPGAPPEEGKRQTKPKPHAEMNLFVKLKDVKTGFDPYLELALDKVDLFVADRADGKLDVSGEIDIAKAQATYDVDLPTILKALQKPKGGAAGSETYEKREESVFLNIAVRADRGIVFENNLAYIECRADLLLTGSNVDLGMIGTVEVLKGHAQVWNNDYRLTNAMIQFVDETRILPVFDINASTEVKDYKIFVNVSGSPENYQVTLSSDPPQTEQDIVALLTVGVSYSEASAEGGGMGGDQVLAVAAQQLLGSQFQNYTGLQLGVDNSRGTPYFKASKDVQTDLTASLFRSIADPTLAAELEYDLVRNLAVYTDWSNFAGQKDPPPSGGFGAGLRLKIEFR